MNTKDFADLGQAQLEKSIRLSNIALTGVERLVGLQLDVARGLLAENADTVKALSEVKDISGLIALQKQLSQPAADKALAVAKSVYEAASNVQNELGQFVEEQMMDFNKNLVAALDNVAKQAPTGSEAMMSAVKNAVATAASAYDTLSKTAQKVHSDFTKSATHTAERPTKSNPTAKNGASNGANNPN